MTDPGPIPVQWSAPGCPAMVRRVVGQFTSCINPPVWAGICQVRGVGPVRVFLCDEHRELVDGAQAMTDVDRADLDGRRVQWDRALAGLRFERPGPIRDTEEG